MNEHRLFPKLVYATMSTLLGLWSSALSVILVLSGLVAYAGLYNHDVRQTTSLEFYAFAIWLAVLPCIVACATYRQLLKRPKWPMVLFWCAMGSTLIIMPILHAMVGSQR